MDLSMRLYPSKKNIDLQLHVPDSETECPILQESIQSAVFESFPRPFYQEHPEHKAITLGCSHTFHAMALVYHWSRNKTVLCPICRAGPRGQKLVMSNLPETWRYSLASKVRKETRRDKEETEREHFRMAAMLSNEPTSDRSAVSFVIKIEIQAHTMEGAIISWRLNTIFAPNNNAIVFHVPETDLIGIPLFGTGTLIRLIPFAFSAHTINMLRPSEWFAPGSYHPTHAGFCVKYDTEGRFEEIKLTIQEEEFTTLIVQAYIAAGNSNNRIHI
jgi:hypothetical protein